MYKSVGMRVTNPFSSIFLSIPEDASEDHDDRVSSYWRNGDTCLLQVSSCVRQTGVQISAAQRLSERTKTSEKWATFDLPRKPTGCDVAAAAMADEEASWVHIYLVWPWVAVYVTVSSEASHERCSWVWDSLASIRTVVM